MLDSYEIDNATISWACNVQLVTLPSPDGERSFENEWMHISVHILWSYQELIPLRLCNTAPVYCTRIITLHTQSNFERSGSSFPVKIMLWYFASRTKLILWTIRCTLLQAAPTILWKLCTQTAPKYNPQTLSLINWAYHVVIAFYCGKRLLYCRCITAATRLNERSVNVWMQTHSWLQPNWASNNPLQQQKEEVS